MEETALALLAERMERLSDYTREREMTLLYRREDRHWVLENAGDLYPDLPDAASLYAAAPA